MSLVQSSKDLADLDILLEKGDYRIARVTTSGILHRDAYVLLPRWCRGGPVFVLVEKRPQWAKYLKKAKR